MFTWTSMDLARNSLGFTPEEKHFTDHHLIELSRRHRPRVFASRSRIREHSTGADFEWWIRDQNDFIGLLVQAKRLTMAAHGYYEDVDRKTANGSPQPDQLIATAAREQMVPLYVLYNGPIVGFPAGRCRGSLPLQARGCTVASAVRMSRLAAANSRAALADVQDEAIPWECMLTCPLALGNSLPKRIRAVLEGYGMLSASETLGFDQLPSRAKTLFALLAEGAGMSDTEDGADEELPEEVLAAAESGVARTIVALDATDT